MVPWICFRLRMQGDMGFKTHYFSSKPDDPAPLSASTSRRVRFEEVDALGMVWHGRYPSYLEDGRIAFGDGYGLTYQSFRKNSVIAPVVQMHLDYLTPLRFDDIIEIETTLYWSEALRLNFVYRISGPEGQLVARGYTVQLFTDPGGELLIVAPSWLQEFRQKWQDGGFV